MNYRAPLKDLLFVLEHLLHASELARLARYGDYGAELAESILLEAARFGEQVLAPINALGDRTGATWSPTGVCMPEPFRQAYEQFVAAGWPQLTVDTAHGGQGAPLVLGAAAEEIWFGANLAFMLCPLLGRGAAEALEAVGSRELQQRFLPKLNAGTWAGTMNLTESQAGSDLSAIRTRAVLQSEGGHYLLFGQKIFITYGEHDMAENIVHLVLARIEGAPPGIKGISLFVVPKLLPRADAIADGTADAAQEEPLVRRNDLRCVSIEHKLGIHASPTCVMSYGEERGAVGYLVGEPHHGLEYMFVMMNTARLSVGVQGVGLAELALQQAGDWAHSRVQGRVLPAASAPAAASDAHTTIVEHPDVRRMLLTIKANVEAMRALALYTALQLDRARAEPEAAQRARALARGELLIPIVKGYCTEQANTLASLSIQIHGGVGFIEETGAAQTLRDARITSIYEGTTGIQANDLLGRKLARDRAAAITAMIHDMLRELDAVRAADPALRAIKNAAIEAVTVLRDATEALLPQYQDTPARAYAVAVPYLELCGLVMGGWLMARSAAAAALELVTAGADREFLQAKLQTARFYAEHLLPQTLSLARVVKSGGASVTDADPRLV
jgi:alkylation response protein AidB-like acyl-CoA dehydrogenase